VVRAITGVPALLAHAAVMARAVSRQRPAATSSYGGGVVEAKRNRWTNWLY
jgi:hypothetical protein